MSSHWLSHGGHAPHPLQERSVLNGHEVKGKGMYLVVDDQTGKDAIATLHNKN